MALSAAGCGGGDETADGSTVTTAAGAEGGLATGPTAPADGGEVVVGTPVGLNTLTVGICYDDPAADAAPETEVGSVNVLPCDQEHDSEVFHVGVLDAGDFPGDENVQADVVAACVERFAGFVGLAYEDSQLEISYFYPGQSAWDADDRSYICSVFDLAGEKLQGSMANTGI